jgi:hypothetical protein
MKKKHNKNAWLFAFTDLSFLLLISLSMLPGNASDFSLRLAQMELPAVPDSRSLQPVTAPDDPWELRILPPVESAGLPFRLVHAGKNEGIDCNEESLIPALQNLHELNIKPVLLPDKASLSQDFLFAAGALARVWSVAESSLVVRPLAAGENR